MEPKPPEVERALREFAEYLLRLAVLDQPRCPCNCLKTLNAEDIEGAAAVFGISVNTEDAITPQWERTVYAST